VRVLALVRTPLRVKYLPVLGRGNTVPASFLGDQTLQNGEFLLIVQTLLFQSSQLMPAVSGYRGVAKDVD
jgi:hypothetical protein